MRTNIDEIIKGIERDLNKYCNSVAKNMAKNISEDLTREAQKSIEDFYSDYTPIYYNRYYNFKYSYKKYYKNHGDHFSGGVELLMDKIPDVYSDPVDEVFYRVYAGFHGYASIFDNNIYEVINGSGKLTGVYKKHNGFIPPRTIPSPMDRLIQKRNDILKNPKKYQDNAIQSAKKEKYNYLSF